MTSSIQSSSVKRKAEEYSDASSAVKKAKVDHVKVNKPAKYNHLQIIFNFLNEAEQLQFRGVSKKYRDTAWDIIRAEKVTWVNSRIEQCNRLGNSLTERNQQLFIKTLNLAAKRFYNGIDASSSFFMNKGENNLAFIIHNFQGYIILNDKGNMMEGMSKKVWRVISMTGEECVGLVQIAKTQGEDLLKNPYLRLEHEILRFIQAQPEADRVCFPNTYFLNLSSQQMAIIQKKIKSRFSDIYKSGLLHKLPLNNLIKIGACLIKGIGQLHKWGIVHCDLNSDNILITGEGLAIITDFGSSALTPDSPIKMGPIPLRGRGVHTLQPSEFAEAILKAKTEEELSNACKLLCQFSNDIWQLGNLFSMLFFHTRIQYSSTDINKRRLEMVQWRKENVIPVELPEWAENTPMGKLISFMFHHDRAKRPKIGFVRDAFINQVNLQMERQFKSLAEIIANI